MPMRVPLDLEKCPFSDEMTRVESSTERIFKFVKMLSVDHGDGWLYPKLTKFSEAEFMQ